METEILHNHEAERMVLGTILSERNAMAETRDLLTAEHFDNGKYATIYRACCALDKRGERIDIITAYEELHRAGEHITPYEVAVIGGNYTPDLAEYIEILTEKLHRRKLFNLGHLLQAQASSYALEVEEIVAEAKEKMTNITTDTKAQYSSLADAISNVYKTIDRNMAGDTAVTGSPTGFSELDKHLGGLQPSDLIIVAAESSQGKTSFAIKLAKEAGTPVAFYSLEMKKEQIASRLMSMESGVPSSTIQFKPLSESQLIAVDKGVSRLNSTQIFFDDRSTSNIETILSSIRTLKAKLNISGAVVDYLQILSINQRGSNKEQQMAEAARRLKNLAKELDIWIVALSQLNRNQENPEPSISRLRDSGQIAEAADVVLLIYRPSFYNKRYRDTEFKETNPNGTALIHVAKGRNYGLKKFIVGFHAATTLFHDLSELPRIAPTQMDEDEKLPF